MSKQNSAPNLTQEHIEDFKDQLRRKIASESVKIQEQEAILPPPGRFTRLALTALGQKKKLKDYERYLQSARFENRGRRITLTLLEENASSVIDMAQSAQEEPASSKPSLPYDRTVEGTEPPSIIRITYDSEKSEYGETKVGLTVYPVPFLVDSKGNGSDFRARKQLLIAKECSSTVVPSENSTNEVPSEGV